MFFLGTGKSVATTFMSYDCGVSFTFDLRDLVTTAFM
jgi:hypothetical protein